MTIVPKLALDVMSCEVVRLLQLTKSSVVPLSYCVPRRVRNEQSHCRKLRWSLFLSVDSLPVRGWGTPFNGCLKGVPFLGFRYIEGKGFLKLKDMKGREICHFVF